MIDTQKPIAASAAQFIDRYGLKAKFVAEQVYVSKNIFSKFMNNRLALTSNQLARLQSFMDDYQRRMS